MTWATAAVVLTMIIAILDVWSTESGLYNNDNAVETNGLIARLMSVLGPKWAIPRFVGALGLCVIAYLTDVTFWLWPSIVAGIAAVVNNFRIGSGRSSLF